MRPFVDALVQAAPDRTVWGSNWPHPHQNPVPDATEWLAATSRWLGADRVRRILSENPGRLYDFDIPKGGIPMKLLVVPGDGIGPEICAATVQSLKIS